MSKSAVSKPVETPLRSLHSAAIHDTDNLCRDEECPIEHLHAAHKPRIRRGPKTKIRSI